MILSDSHVKEILNLYNYFSMAIITNEHGVVEYFYNNRPDINTITEKQILGHNVLESCANLTEETSTIFHVLRTGESVNNLYQELITSNGDLVCSYCSTMPIKDGDKIIGVVEVAKYVDLKSKQGEHNSTVIQPISISNISRREEADLYCLDDIKGISKGIQRLRYKIECVANTDSTVLIYGETGTGKELVAESIHTAGRRCEKRFVSQNCAAIPPNLLEGILFGTEKGSYTGAETRKGLLEAASGGTLFLDEINMMDVNTQSKILKAIEEKKIMRVGGTEAIPVDVRIIAAVNVNPRICLKKQDLREDLYFRLRVVELKVPPLRERKEDIPQLVDFFIQYYNHKMGKYIVGLSEELTQLFMEYDWPGNVRELKNAIEGGFNMAVTPIMEVGDMCLGNPCFDQREVQTDYRKMPIVPLKKILYEKERELILQVCKNSKTTTEAAASLGISRQMLAKKLEKYE